MEYYSHSFDVIAFFPSKWGVGIYINMIYRVNWIYDQTHSIVYLYRVSHDMTFKDIFKLHFVLQFNASVVLLYLLSKDSSHEFSS